MEGLPYIPTRAVVSGPHTAPVTLTQRFEADEPLSVLLDPRFSFTHGAGDRLSLGGHLDWWMSGLEVRMLPLGTHVDTPVVVAVGAQLDGPARILGLTDATIWDVRAQLSVHPKLHGVQAILGAGFSAGRQAHDLVMPDELAHGPDAGFAAPVVLRALRREGRLEGVIGLSFPVWGGRIALAVQPFYVVAQGAVSTTPCGYCFDQLRVDSLDASWGAAFTLAVLGSAR
jgi:hypothetical protein